mgnify:CR=1 FL=1
MHTIRPPAVAGAFYPGRSQTLSHDVLAMLAAARPDPASATMAAPKALIVPHAGYIYSGATAALALMASLTLGGAVIPDKLAVNSVTGKIFVCDVGRGQCVWIFDAQGRPDGHFGKVGGVYQNKIPGRVDATHLYFPRAITFDDTGCLYLAMVPRTGWVGGALLRKHDPTGKKVLWERQSLEFQEAADGDPGIDDEHQ